MDTQPGSRTALVDPFGRELEEWLRDTPAVRAPYVPDLVVPPVTGPITRPVVDAGMHGVDAGAHGVDRAPVAADATIDALRPSTDLDEASADEALSDVRSTHDLPAEAAPSTPSFRRERGRHATACAPSFPEPPERLSLRIGDLAVLVSSASGRSTIERIDVLERELEQRENDLARLAAWEAVVDEHEDPEVHAARAYAHGVFADLLADAAQEADLRERRREAVRSGRSVSSVVPLPATSAASASSDPLVLIFPAAASSASAAPGSSVRASAVSGSAVPASAVSDSAVPASPVSARTRPTPLIQPATGPQAIQRAAFEEAIRTHTGPTEIASVFPEDMVREVRAAEADREADRADADGADLAEVPGSVRATDAETLVAPTGWWSRIVGGILRALGRR